MQIVVANEGEKSFLCNHQNDLVAQLVEQLTLNQWVESSSLSQVTLIKRLQI